MLSLWLCVATAAQAARTEFFGIAQGPLDASDAQQMADVGVRTERFMLRWRSVERTRGSYDWGSRDWLVGALASRGIRPAPFVWGSPQWVGNGAAARPPLGTAADIQAWQSFLRAAVARYGPGGSYWANGYRQRFGADATPLPIQSWQVWNEPNLKKYFAPGATAYQSVQKYARLLEISHDAIKSRDAQAQIVLAGMPAYGDVTAWRFLNNLYGISGAKGDFDVAALHPYARNVGGLRWTTEQFRAAMTSHSDGTTPLWLTELAWGSGPPDEFGYNKGAAGQQQLLLDSFRLILQNRDQWNVQRLFWFLWHDPPPGSDYAKLCSICGTAGLVRYNRTPKPAYSAFTGFTAETIPPVARIASGPTHGSFINDSTPAFQLASSEPGSTFECRFAQSWSPCGSQFVVASPLRDGPQTFSVKAIDAPGNESAVRTRSFTVDTTAPTVRISAGPAEGSIWSSPDHSFDFTSNDPGASVSCQLDGGGFSDCSSPFTASGLADGSHTFRVRATDIAQNTHVVSRTWTVDTTPPTASISSGPAEGSTSSDRSPTFRFASDEPDVSFSCRLGSAGAFRACDSPFTASGLADRAYTFQVRATDAAQNTHVASRTWTLDGPADVSITAGPASGSVSKNATPSFAFSSLDSDPSFRCRIDGAPLAPCTSPVATSTLSDGSHTFLVEATDAAQTVDVAWRVFSVDATAPAVTIRGRRRVPTKRRKTSAAFTLRASEEVDRRCRVDSRRFAPCSWRFRSPKLGRGAHTLQVKARDQVGNVGTERKRFKIVRK
ncbi:MAG TPA: glycosyl hydrolase [Methylomirabilota bacterium]|nr:glycosyl hydrolase [Methylomirabilota bacterium]